MAQFLTNFKWGNGHDGSPAVSGTINSYATCTGTATESSLTTTLSASAGDIILIHQSQGTGVGQWELNYVLADAGATLTLAHPLAYTYASGAQAVLIPQYTGGTLSGAVTGTAWAGSTGGIIALMSNGSLTISGSLSINGSGFRYGNGVQAANDIGYQGEGHSSGTQTKSRDANGSGGGGGNNASGAGGSYGDDNGGTGGLNDSTSGDGSTGGVAALTTLYFGGGGGGGCDSGCTAASMKGGSGGGIVFIIAKEITISGSINASGANGSTGDGAWKRAGGGGAGGSVLIKAQKATLGTNLITAIKGNGGGTGALEAGSGGDGRIRIDYYSGITGTTNPTLSSAQDTSFSSEVFVGMV